MSKKYKLYSKKEKTAAVILSSALMSVPFLFDSAYHVQATVTESISPTYKSIDKLGNIIVPLSGSTTTLDLNSIYGTSNSYFYVTSSNDTVAYNEVGHASAGVLKIHPNMVGTATFTVSYSQGNYLYNDVFDVTVDSTITVERKFDITDTVKRILVDPSLYTSASSVKELLSGIGPAKTLGNLEGNHPPVMQPENPFNNQEYEQGHSEPLGDLRLFFRDTDYQNSIHISVLRTSGTAASFLQSTDGQSWSIEAQNMGISTFVVVARDSYGGVMTTAPFTVTVTENQDPIIDTSNALANHLSDEDHMLYLSSNSQVDLDEIFYDSDKLHYKAKISYFDSGTVTQTINIIDNSENSTHILSWDLIKNQLPEGIESSVSITELFAYDDYNSNPASLNVLIEEDDYNNFPEMFDMYASNEAGTSSYLLDYERRGLGGGISLLNIRSDNNAVTAAVYEQNNNNYFKFNAGSVPDEKSRIKVLSVLNESLGNVWYQNDIVVNVISPSNTPQYPAGVPAISLSNLYYPDDEINWNMNFNDYVTLSTVTAVTYNSDESGDYTVRISDSEPAGTRTILTIDPDARDEEYFESRVFIVPIIKP